MKPTKDDIRRRLGLREVPKPPEDLARRIKAEIPSSFRYREHVSAGAKVNGATAASWGLSWQVAASFLALTIVGVGIYMVTYESQKAETASTIAEADGRQNVEFAPPTAQSAPARAAEAPGAKEKQREPSSNFAFDIAAAPSAPPPPPRIQDADSGVAGGAEGRVEGGVAGGVLGGVIGGVAPEPATESDDYRSEKLNEEQLAKSQDKGFAEEKESISVTAAAPAVMAEAVPRDGKDERARSTTAAQSAATKPASAGESHTQLRAKADSGEPLRAGGAVKAPVISKRVGLDIPLEGTRVDAAASPVVELIVDRKGDVMSVRVLEPSPLVEDNEVVATVKQWKFKPGTLEGKPVTTIVTVTVEPNQTAGDSAAVSYGGISRGSLIDDVSAPQPLRVGGDVKAPIVIKRVELVYPEDAKKAKITGIVIIETIIDRDGNVKLARVLKPLPMGLDEAAVAAVKQWKFKPATLHGKPVEVFFNVTVNAKLGE